MTFKFPEKLPKAWLDKIEKANSGNPVLLTLPGNPNGRRAFGVVPPVGKDLKVIIDWEDGGYDTYNKGDALPSNLSTAIRIHFENSICKYSHNAPWLGTDIVCFNKLENETVELFLASVLELEYPDEYQMLDFDAEIWTLESLEWVANGVKAHFTTTNFPLLYIDFILNEPDEKLKFGYTLNEVSYTKPTTETALRIQLKFSDRVRFTGADGNPHEETDLGNWSYKSRPRFRIDNKTGYVLPIEAERSWIKCSGKKVWVISAFGRGFGSKVVDDKFGNEAAGGSLAPIGELEDMIWGSKFTCPAAGVLKFITAFIETGSTAGGAKINAAIYKADLSLLGGGTEKTRGIGLIQQWEAFTMSDEALVNADYILVAWADADDFPGSDYALLWGEAVDPTNDYQQARDYDLSWPDPTTATTQGQMRVFAIYATYEPPAPPPPVPANPLIGKPLICPDIIKKAIIR